MGSSGDFHNSPQLIQLDAQITLLGLKYDILGHACYDYGPGWWDEYWTLDERGEGAWISVDEGEIILQWPWSEATKLNFKKAPKLGDRFTAAGEKYRVVEADEATCIAVQGDFPNILRVGQTYRFVNCLTEHGELLSGEFSEGTAEWYKGVWIDPFDIAAMNPQ